MITTAPINIPADAKQLLLQHFDIHGQLTKLNGEVDENYHVVADDAQYLLKLSSVTDDMVALQDAVLLHLQKQEHGVCVPKLYGGRWVSLHSTQPTMMRLYSWVQGKLLGEVKYHTQALLQQLGRKIGALTVTLANFKHPAAKRESHWDLQQVAWVLQHLDALPVEHRACVTAYANRFLQHTYPVLPTLRQSVIHGDLNDYNIVVTGELGQENISGFIDFGDVLQSATVCDVAIAAAYAMLHKPEPLMAAADVVRGFHAVFPLQEKEIQHLYSLITMRLCVSVINAALRKREQPQNNYLTISERPALQVLHLLNDISPDFAHYVFREACGLAPCPDTARIVNWLTANASNISPLFDVNLSNVKHHILDLTPANTSSSHADRLDSIRLRSPFVLRSARSARLEGLLQINEALRDGAARLLRANGSEIRANGNLIQPNLPAYSDDIPVIGRYNEARLIYTAAQYANETNHGTESRTIHLGLDIGLPAEEPVYAPLDGVIESIADNNAPQDYGATIILKHQLPETDISFYTLYGHLSRASLQHWKQGQIVKAGTRLGEIGHEAENGGWTPHLHLQIITDLLGNFGNFPGTARASLRNLWLSICPDPNLLLQLSSLTEKQHHHTSLLEDRKQLLGRNLSLAYETPLHIVRGRQQYLFDVNGKRYLDGVNNVCHVGHCHPDVTHAVSQQMSRLNTNTRYLHENIIQYAKQLLRTLPSSLTVCYFVNSGSEANELAWRLARAYTKRNDMVVLDHAYHGNTTNLIGMSPYKVNRSGKHVKPDNVHVLPLPDAQYQQNRTTLSDISLSTAAFLSEAMPGCAGQIELPAGYLQTIYKAARQCGAVCIADEVQVGLGRLGTHFWGFETQDVIPDIVTMGKPLGNGFPLGAVVTTRCIADAFADEMEYFNTFGGNPVACAAGMAVLEVMAKEGLQQQALIVGSYLKERLQALADKHDIITAVRGRGLYLGLAIKDAAIARFMVNRLQERGILLSVDGVSRDVIKFKPPMVFNQQDADTLIAALELVISFAL